MRDKENGGRNGRFILRWKAGAVVGDGEPKQNQVGLGHKLVLTENLKMIP